MPMGKMKKIPQNVGSMYQKQKKLSNRGKDMTSFIQRTLEPPDDDTWENRRYWQIKDRLWDIQLEKRRLEDEQETLQWELEEMGWTG